MTHIIGRRCSVSAILCVAVCEGRHLLVYLLSTERRALSLQQLSRPLSGLSRGVVKLGLLGKKTFKT